MPGLTPKDLGQGARWLWRGKPVRLDGPQELLSLGHSIGSQDIQMRAARSVRKLIHSVADVRDRRHVHGYSPETEPAVHLTDGQNSYFMHFLDTPVGVLVMFEDGLPPADTELWVVRARAKVPEDAAPKGPPDMGLVAVSADAQVDTPLGKLAASDIVAGQMITTLDRGPIPALWAGVRTVSGARLHVIPQLRPVRIKAGALGNGCPSKDILVAARQRVLLRGTMALDLYNVSEVLVAAKDMVNGRSIFLDSRVRSVSYAMIMFDTHDVFRADGVMVESFHPGRANLDYLEPAQKDEVLATLAHAGTTPGGYGDSTRRSLSASEAAILRFANDAG